MKTPVQIFHGFTLIELVVTVAIAAILLAIAIPNFTNFLQDTAIVTETNKLTRDLTTARSEAIRRGIRVSMCVSNNGNACAGANWANGWIMFTDTIPAPLGNGTLDAGEVILQVNDGLRPLFTLNTVPIITAITYAPSGVPNIPATFRVCRPDQNAALSRAVNVANTGRVNVRTLAAAGLVCP